MFYLIAASMGYGHLRAAWPLKKWAYKKNILTINDYKQIPYSDLKIWKYTESFYNFISRLRSFPFIGWISFSLFDRLFQYIPELKKTEKSKKPSLTLILNEKMILKKNFGKDLISRISEKPYPVVTTFFTAAFMAELHGYPQKIFCIATDSDLNRAWAPVYSEKSKIIYFTPTKRATERLLTYGVKKKNIIFTGFPLPQENINSLKYDLSYRLAGLDRDGSFIREQKILQKLGLKRLPLRKTPLSIMFATGGAGAQKEIGADIIKSLAFDLKSGKIKLVIVAGVHLFLKEFFISCIRKNKLQDCLTTSIEILYEKDKFSYFKRFNKTLKTTDILWTKPSELSFYTALGLPIIIAPCIGYQEEYNKNWLLSIGSGICQKKPLKTKEWLFQLIENKTFAKAAWLGYLNAPKDGTKKIVSIVKKFIKQQ